MSTKRTLVLIAATIGAKPLLRYIKERVNPKQFDEVEILPMDTSAIKYAVPPPREITSLQYAEKYALMLAEEAHQRAIPFCSEDATIISVATKGQRFSMLDTRAQKEGCEMFSPQSFEEVLKFWEKYLYDGFSLHVGIHTSKKVLQRTGKSKSLEYNSLCLRDDMRDDIFFRIFLMSQTLLCGFNDSGPDAPFNEGYFKHLLYPHPIPDVNANILSMRLVTWILSDLLSPDAFIQYTEKEVGEKLWELASLERHWTWKKTRENR